MWFSRALAVLALGAGAAACFEEPRPACLFRCGEGEACPEGYQCGDDGRCHRVDPEGLAECPDPLPADAQVFDASTFDAEVPDGAPVDATPIDATPTVPEL